MGDVFDRALQIEHLAVIVVHDMRIFRNPNGFARLAAECGRDEIHYAIFGQHLGNEFVPTIRFRVKSLTPVIDCG